MPPLRLGVVVAAASQAGPLSGDLSSTAWPVFSTPNMVDHAAAGLVTLFVVAGKGQLKADGVTPTDVDALLPLVFQVRRGSAVLPARAGGAVPRVALPAGAREGHTGQHL